jgi:hypothetical protein
MMRFINNILKNIIMKNNSKNGFSKIPFNQQYETKDFILKDNNNKIGVFKYKSNIYPSSKIPYNEQYETKDFNTRI